MSRACSGSRGRRSTGWCGKCCPGNGSGRLSCCGGSRIRRSSSSASGSARRQRGVGYAHFAQRGNPSATNADIDSRSNADGRHPVRLLPLRDRAFRLTRLPSSLGISPLRRSDSSASRLNWVRFPSSTGISPVNWLPAPRMINSLRLVRLPNCAGISPPHPQESRFNISKLARLPNSAGISPRSEGFLETVPDEVDSSCSW